MSDKGEYRWVDELDLGVRGCNRYCPCNKIPSLSPPYGLNNVCVINQTGSLNAFHVFNSPAKC